MILIVYILKMIGFDKTPVKYIQEDKIVLGVIAESIIFANNLQGNLGLLNTKLDVHCAEGENAGKVDYPIKGNIKLTNTTALAIRKFPNGIEVIG